VRDVVLTPPRIATAGFLGAGALLAALPVTGAGIPCPLHSTTGLWCPLCGGTRMARSLVRGDLAAAAGFNLLALVAAPFALYALAAWCFPTRVPTPALPRWALPMLGAIALVFTVARNLPIGAALAP
jgi:hypothetical protein